MPDLHDTPGSATVARLASTGRLRADPRIPSTALPDERGITGAIGQLYDAGLGDEDWATALVRVQRLLGGESVALLRTGTPAATDVAVHVGCDPDFIPPYDAYYRPLSPVLPVMLRLPPGSVFTHHMLVPDSAYHRTEYYNDHIRPQGKHSSLFWIDAADRGRRTFLCLWRSRRLPEWEDRQRRLLGVLGPHLGRALEMRRRLAAVATPRPDAGPLAPRERECLACVAQGASSKQAGRLLGLSMNTVNAYLASARRKLNAASRSEAVALALSRGLLDL
jgi:DNA-binding CsgD family transcriptional regulator